MLHHVADLVGRGHVPAEVMEARVDEEDIAFPHLHPLLDHLRRVDVVVAADIGEIDDRARTDQEVHVQAGNVFAWREEVDLPVQVGAQVVRVRQQLSVRAVGRQPLEVLHLQRLIRGPGRRCDAQWDGQVDDLHMYMPPQIFLKTSEVSKTSEVYFDPKSAMK